MTEMMLLSVLTGICLVAAVAAIAALIKAGALSKQLDEFRKSDQNTTAMLQAFGSKRQCRKHGQKACGHQYAFFADGTGKQQTARRNAKNR